MVQEKNPKHHFAQMQRKTYMLVEKMTWVQQLIFTAKKQENMGIAVMYIYQGIFL